MSARTGPVGVGIIGAGMISGTYLENMTQFPDLRVHFVADFDIERARSRAEEYGIPGYGSIAELLARDEIEIVVNLTIPKFHTDIGHRILAAGKHVWSEKPLALDRESARHLLDSAAASGLQVACAPDTVLGAGIQSARRAIARGDIGEPLTARSIFEVPGPELWHPSPEFLFTRGAGPLFDMGPYYVTTLVTVFGPVSQVSAVSSTSRHTRVIGSGPRAGTRFPVDVPTHHAALITFAGGRSAQSTFSFQSARLRYGVLEISGTEGTIVLPDPNAFEGSSELWRPGADQPTILESRGATYGRGLGIVNLARAVRGYEPVRAGGDVALHVLDVLLAISTSAETATVTRVGSSATPTPPVPEEWDPAAATLS